MLIQRLDRELSNLDLIMRTHEGGNSLFIKGKNTIEPIMFFDPYTSDQECSQSINIMANNAIYYTETQIRKSLMLVSDFLETPIEERNL